MIRRGRPRVVDQDTWQCAGRASSTSRFTRSDFLENFDARFVIAVQGPIDGALAHRRRVRKNHDTTDESRVLSWHV